MDQVSFVHGDAAGHVCDEPADLAACLGATWIGGAPGTVDLLARSLRPGGPDAGRRAVLAPRGARPGDRRGLPRPRPAGLPAPARADRPLRRPRVRRGRDGPGRPGQLGPLPGGPVARPAPPARHPPRRRTGPRVPAHARHRPPAVRAVSARVPGLGGCSR
ncbi:Methyltransferase type 12 [Streptomyces sp. PVA_94-07]|nr:Methyltransferase type 12 [Streptomyces sp. PVA_94-07]